MSASQQAEIANAFQSPSTRYQGSKRKILPWIWNHLKSRNFESVLDVFGGTGSVSYLFKQMGKRVTYNDYMRWNYLIGTALIENDHVTLASEDLDLLTKPVDRSQADFVANTFRGMYFTNTENIWVDALIARINQIKASPKDLKYKTAVAYYALFQSCLAKRPFNLFHRVNLSLREANVPRSFGNKTTWDKPFAEHFRSFAEEINGFIKRGARPCRAINHEANEIPAQSYDLVYLDPPYIKSNSSNETANYARCYHFLEGLAGYKKWPSLIDHSTTLKAIAISKDNAWTNIGGNLHAFAALFDKFHESIIVISYKKYGCPSIDTLIRMLKRRGKRVNLHTKHYKYALNNQNGCSSLNRECLIIAE